MQWAVGRQKTCLKIIGILILTRHNIIAFNVDLSRVIFIVTILVLDFCLFGHKIFQKKVVSDLIKI